MIIELSALRHVLTSPRHDFGDLLSFSLRLLTPQSAFEVARLAVARHATFYEQHISEPEMIQAWLFAVYQRQSLDGREELRFNYWLQEPGSLQWSIYWGFVRLGVAYYEAFFPEKIDIHVEGSFDLYDGLLTLMHCLMHDIRMKFIPVQVDLIHQDENSPEFQDALARATAYRDSPERLQRHKDIWLPVIEDMERLFLLQEHAYPSKLLGQMRDEWPWPSWSYRIWNQYLNSKAKKDAENAPKQE